MGDSLEKLSGFPPNAKKQLGFALRQVQNGLTPTISRPLTSFGSGVYEIKSDSDGDAYRVAYLLKLKDGVYVLDAFMKKSKSGRKIPREIENRLKQRIKDAKTKDRG